MQDLRLERWPETTEPLGTHLAFTTKGAGSNIFKDVLGREGVTSHSLGDDKLGVLETKVGPEFAFPVLRREVPLRTKGSKEKEGREKGSEGGEKKGDT